MLAGLLFRPGARLQPRCGLADGLRLVELSCFCRGETVCQPGDTSREVAGVTVCWCCCQRVWSKAFNTGKALHLWGWAVGILIKLPPLNGGVQSHPLGCGDVQCGLRPSAGCCHKVCWAGVHARSCSPAEFSICFECTCNGSAFRVRS